MRTRKIGWQVHAMAAVLTAIVVLGLFALWSMKVDFDAAQDAGPVSLCQVIR